MEVRCITKNGGFTCVEIFHSYAYLITHMHMDVKGKGFFWFIFLYLLLLWVLFGLFVFILFRFFVLYMYESFYLQLEELFSKCYFGIYLCIYQLWWHWLLKIYCVSDSLTVAVRVQLGIPYLSNVKVRQSTFKTKWWRSFVI